MPIKDEVLESGQRNVAVDPVGNSALRLDVIGIAYALALFASMAVWVTTLRAPLWLDETNSYWQISEGFSKLWARQGLTFPVYPFLLLCYTKIFGTSEIALRIPHLVVMAAAAYMMYKTARLLFRHDVAMFATILFCLHPIVAFAADDVRPYAFAALATNAAMYWLLRWVSTDSRRDAFWFGITSAFIVYFHYIFGVILVVFLAFSIAFRWKDWSRFKTQIVYAAAPFTVMMVPVIPRLWKLFTTAGSHVFAERPHWMEILKVFNPFDFLLTFSLLFLVVLMLRSWSFEPESATARYACLFFGFGPILLLYWISVYTPIHIFIDRYKLVAVPGIALCWGFWISRLDSKWLRLAFCLFCVYHVLAMHEVSLYGRHEYSWKDSIVEVNRLTAENPATVFICSDMPESDSGPLPTDAKASPMFSPLNYYHLDATVIALPRSRTGGSKQQLDSYLAQPGAANRKFLVMAFSASYNNVHWIMKYTQDRFTSKNLGMFDGVSIYEFTPVQSSTAASAK